MALCCVWWIFMIVWTCSSALPFLTSGDPKLKQYNVNKDAVSVSGISSGGAMAVQYHVALSSKLMGLGVMAGVPYGCADTSGALTCMSQPSQINTSSLLAVANAASSLGTIDSTSHLRNDRVFVYHSKSDSVVKFGVGEKVVQFFQHFITTSCNIKSEFNIASAHGVPTLNYGNACNEYGSPYLLNCSYSAAFHILNHIYGGHLQAPTTSTHQAGKILKFDQSQFLNLTSPEVYGMDRVGYLYVPSGCADKTKVCKLHIVFHGCQQGREFLNKAFVRHTGYNEVGELNNIIIMYPQVKPSLVNPNGCWDWWGYTGIDYGTKSGFQITGVRRMMERVLG